MILLGLETSSMVCSVGIAVSDGSRFERSVVENHVHSEKLLTLVREVCAEANVALASLEGVAVSTGPGSFTGLRIGMSTAKGLCLSLQIPLFIVPTFEGAATAALPDFPEQEAVFLVDARQGDWYAATYGLQGNIPVAIHEASVVRFGDGRFFRQDFAGLVLTDQQDKIRPDFPSGNVKDIAPYFRGDAVARAGLEHARRGQTADVAGAEPAYLKDFVVIPRG